jgi:mannose-6-phosphate isomerase-like protein (cupin superfamily)
LTRHRAVRIGDVPRIPVTGHGDWRPIRRALGITAFGANGSTADAGEAVIEPHDERSPGAGGHEELYVVLSGHAVFAVDGEEVDAPAGTLVLVDPGAPREATATADDTTVLIVGGRPGAALPVSPFEHWYAAHAHYLETDYETAIEVVSAGLADHPDHPQILYQRACYRALGGDREGALADLAVAVAGDPRTAEWAQEDEDLDAIRDDPRFPASPA